MEEDFNSGLIQASLIKQFHNILEQYPDDGQIVKELIQNAEDAGAGTVKFLIDHTQYGTDTVAFPQLKTQQGPALYAYNDAVFRDEDWKGIRMIQDSVKAQDPLKVGRFGLGFKSVFHMTDLPGILSGNHIGFLDPQEEYLYKDEKSQVTGKIRQTKTSSRVWPINAKLGDMDQFTPFIHDIFGVQRDTFTKGNYQGTVFRFPLRIHQRSQVSNTIYTCDKVRGLFKQFNQDGHFLLLFLKHVHTIEVYEKIPKQATLRLHQIKIADRVCDSVVRKRKQFMDGLRPHLESCKPNAARQYGNMDPVASSYFLTTEMNGSDKCNWLVTQLFDTQVYFSQNDEKRRNLPLVGVALPLSSGAAQKPLATGHTFCFLPMPLTEDNKTGLNVHVNGYFAVDQNRRHLKWPEIETASGIDVQWNLQLQNIVLPSAMWSLVRFAVDYNERHPAKVKILDVYRIFPNLESVQQNWRPVMEPFWQQIVEHKCLFTSLNTWVLPENAYLVRNKDKQYADLIVKVMEQARIALVQPQTHIHDQLVQRNVCKKITPSIVSCHLDAKILNSEEKRAMTKYLFDGQGSQLLIGKQLLPLENGSFDCFASNKKNPVYLETHECQKSLLPRNERKSMIVGCGLDDANYKLYAKIAKKGETQLSFLTTHIIPDLLGDMFETMQRPHKLQLAWLKELWRHILTQSDVESFETLPIVPCTQNHWDLLLEERPYVAVGASDGELKNLELSEDILKKMGLKPVQFMHYIIPNEYKSAIHRYVSPATVNGILDALLKLKPKDILDGMVKLGNDEKKLLLKFMSTGCGGLKLEHQKVLEAMPLLYCYDSTKSEAQYECKSSEIKCCATIDLPAPLPVKVVNKKESGKIAEIVGIPLLTDTAVLLDFVFPAIRSSRYTSKQVELIMDKVLKSTEHHEENDVDFKLSLKQVPFLESRKALVAPETLLNPLDVNMEKMFKGLDVFPRGRFAKKQAVRKLQDCFMTDVTDELVVELAEFLQKSDQEPNCLNQICEQSELLHSHVVKNQSKIGAQSFEKLTDLKWLPVQGTGPKYYPKGIPWYGETCRLDSPAAVHGREYEYVIGSVMPVSKIELPEDLRRRLHCKSKPKLDDVIRHLSNIVKYFQPGEISPVSMLTKVYSYMAAHNSQELQHCLSALQCENWIWADGKFRTTAEVTVNAIPVEVKPYLVELPDKFKEWTQMFINQGIKENTPLENVLIQIRNCHKNGTPTRKDYKRDLQICINILKYFEENGSVEAELEWSDLLVPCQSESKTSLNLVEVRRCTYSENGEVEYEDETDEKLLLVHPDVPYSVIKFLGIRNITTRYLNAQELDFESFGQTEPLTRRIRGLLDDYKDGVAILKELIQNADDAGAREVHFMYDDRDFTKSSTSLIDTNMQNLQGPALLCYNDAIFSEEDFKNIVKLSGATKKNKLDQVGRFGLGFNAVYNLTDVPSFISGNDIVFFDPHVKYLKNVITNPSRPGIRLNLKMRKQIVKFKDQFMGFHGILGCDLQNSAVLPTFKGTLFRFPLRTEKQASEISEQCYDRSRVTELLRVLQHNANTLLLFVQNVRKVIISEVTAPCKIQQCGIILKKPLKVLRPLQLPAETTRVVQSDDTEWKVLKRAKDYKGSNDIHNSFLVEISTSFNRNTLFKNKSNSEAAWIVSNVISGSQGQQSLVPVGSTAILLKKMNRSHFCPQKLSNGQVFCFLPLPIKTELPFHINGYFTVTSSRQQLCTQDIDDKPDDNALWNEQLIRGAVTKSLVQSLTDMSMADQVFDKRDLVKCIFDVFPCETQDSLIDQLCRSFYQKLLVDPEPPAILPSACDSWINFQNCLFLDSCLRYMTKAKESEAMFDLCKVQYNSRLVDFPLWMLNVLENFGYSADLAKHRVSLSIFYEKVFMVQINSIHPNKRDMLLQYALLDCDGAVDSILQQRECVPVRVPVHGCDRLMTPGKLIDPNGPLRELYCIYDHLFPLWLTHKYSDSKRQESLKGALIRLGMRFDDIPSAEVITRAKTIKQLAKSDGTSRCKTLLSLLHQKLMRKDVEFEKLANCLKSVDFLPVKEKPDRWPYPWKSDKKFVSPIESFVKEDMYLVGCSEYIAEFPGSKKLHKSLNYVRKDVSYAEIKNQIQHVTKPRNNRDPRVTSEVMENVYDFLNSKAKGDSDALYQAFTDVEFVKVLDGSFVKARKCALSLNKRLDPYLYQLPAGFADTYKDLVSTLQIVHEFSPADLIEILRDLHTEFGGKKLTEKTGRVSVDIASLLAENFKASNVDTAEIYLPDSERVMAKPHELCYNDCDWLQVRDERLLHRLIPHTVAMKLGVQDMRQKTMSQHQFGIPCGQSEKLTNRIKGILDSYPCGSEILKEILQNADDAGAEKVVFILDHRTHKSRKVFSTDWAQLQGPALLVYNDRPFTDADLEGIKNLGQGSKGNDPVTTGKYGVGFNCVYHVTETPMFLTPDGDGDHMLVVFDPHCQYVKGSCPTNPGQMYKHVKNLNERFPDVFRPFHHLPQIDLSCGTLFRFPLRTQNMAFQSQIKREQCTIKDCKSLFDEFTKDIKDYLLFLKSLKEISLLEIDEAGQINEIGGVKSVVKKFQQDLVVDDAVFVNHLKSCGSQIQGVELKDLQCCTVKKLVELDEIGSKTTETERWLVIKQIGFRNPECVTKDLQEKFKRKEASIIPQGGVACKIKPIEEDEGKFFCLLPFYRKTGLPVHINGSFLLDHESRRDLWKAEKDSTSFKILWNKALLAGVVAEIYVDLLEAIASIHGEHVLPRKDADKLLSSFGSLFLNCDRSDEYLSTLQRHVYSALVKRNVKILPVVLHESIWTKIDQPYPWDRKVIIQWHHVYDELNKAFWEDWDSPENYLKIQHIKHILRNSHFPIVHLKWYVREELDKTTNSLHKLHPGAVLRHFLGKSSQQFSMPIPICISASVFGNTTGLKAILSFCGNNLADHFEGLPMLLMKNNTIQRFVKTTEKTLVSNHHYLLPGKKEIFADELFLRYMDVPNCDRYLKEMSLSDLAELRDHALPQSMCLDDGFVPLYPQFIGWLSNFWKFVEASTIRTKSWTDLESTLKHNFKTWCIVPVIIAGKSGYATPNHLDLVIHFLRDNFPNDLLENIFAKLSYPEPLLHVWKTKSSTLPIFSSEMTKKLFITLKQPQAVVMSIRMARLRNYIDVAHLNETDWHKFAVYLNDSLSQNSPQMTCDVQETLMGLPMFKSVFDKNTDLDGGVIEGRVFTVPDTIVKKGMAKWCSEVRKMYLKHDKHLEYLYAKLGIKSLSFVAMYTEHILYHFEHFDDDERFAHLKAMKRFVEDNSDNSFLLLQKLKNTPILKDGENLHFASHFFNPDDTLFKEMEMTFPKDEYYGSDWMNFLQKIGLQFKPAQHHIIGFVQRIEDLSKSHNNLAICGVKCRSLLKAVFEDESLFKNVCSHIENRKFIPQDNPRDGFSGLYCIKMQGTTPFTSFCESVEQKYGKLCWTQRPILPAYAAPRFKWQSQSLRIEPPTIADIIENIRTVCLNYQEGVPFKKGNLLKKFILETFDYLKKHEDKHICDLQELFCILVEDNSKLVRPIQIVIEDLPTEIPPYLYKLPFYLGEYVDLLLKIGAAKKVKPEQYLFVLGEIWKHSGEEPLVPTEITGSKKALSRFFKTFDDTKCKIEKFYLLCKGNNGVKLLLSSNVVYNDYPKWTDRIQKLDLSFMLNLESHVPIQTVERVLHTLPECLQPKFLSAIVTEKARNSLHEVHKSPKCTELEKRLTSDTFRNGIMRILCNFCKDESDMDTENAKDLQKVKFYEVKELVTFLCHDDIEITDSEVRSSFFIERKNCEINVYLDELFQEAVIFDLEIFNIINELMKGRLSSGSLHITALIKCDFDKMEEVLDQLGIKQYDAVSGKRSASHLPPLGSYIPLEFHHLLLLTMCPLRDGEYVGYELLDPLDEMDESSEVLTSEDPVYIYAKICAKMIPDGATSYSSYKYKIQIGHEEYIEDVPASDLYRFSRAIQSSSVVPTDTGSANFEHQMNSDDMEEIKQSVRQTLKEAWTLDTAERKKIIKRLWLLWHPDKNPKEREELCTEVFKYIKWVIDRLERGCTLDTDDTDGAGFHQTYQRQHHRGGGFWSGFNFDGFQRRARSQRQYEEGYKASYEEKYSSHAFYTPPRAKNPQPSEANRWMKQARFDFSAVTVDMMSVQNYEWACFKCHQAAEKALKATQFAVDANSRSRTHDLRMLCYEIDGCSALASELERLLSGSASMRYPDHHSGGKIPHDVYTRNHASQAENLTRQILTSCEQFIENKRNACE